MNLIRILFLLLLLSNSVKGKQTTSESHSGYPSSFSISRPLSELFASESELNRIPAEREMEDRDRRFAQRFLYRAADGTQFGEDASVRQTTIPFNRVSNVLANFPGQVGTGNPPDPSGAAGPNHYVQMINATRMTVYDKSGNSFGTVIAVGNLWNPTVSNGGDPVILYDKYADRWVISQLGNTGNTFYLAVSTSPDPLGTYFTYTYTADDFPDYPKYSIWADGYYMTTNYLSTNPNIPTVVFAFERDEMLVGNPNARFVSAPYDPGVTSSFFLAMPADADGQLPPFGSPLPIISLYDNGWAGGNDSIKIWNVAVDWSTPNATATVTQTPSLLPAAFDASYENSWNDIPQPGTSAMLDGMGGIVQFRAQWRMWTGYNTMVICFPVLISDVPRVRELRWMELRQDQASGLWSVYQQSTFAPDDYCRWMGSIAMDDEGNIALCYAKSGPTSLVPNVFPSLAYTGRLANDSLNTMTFGENVVINGTTILNLTRFGDYSQTSIDPDGLTFWHTGEYVSLGKRTRIYAFRLSSLPVGISSVKEKENISAFASLNSIQVTGIETNQNGLLQLDLYDSKGRNLQSAVTTSTYGNFSFVFDVSDFSAGTYLVRIGKNKSSFQRVFKVILAK